ncbi:hypothetical protein IWQ61_000470 [Dispira simplex]|nr:hypothetical protein IWQ61_000470 [Dispira simplex]
MHKVLLYSLFTLTLVGGSFAQSIPSLKKVGIIASAAYYINKEMIAASVPVNITIFEKNNHIGGRVESVNLPGTSQKFDTGASIFVDINYNVVDFANKLGLDIGSKDRNTVVDNPTTGIWNGTQFPFVFTGNAAVDNINAYNRYGLDTPGAVYTFALDSTNKYLQTYNLSTPFNTIGDLLTATDLSGLLTQTASEALATIPNANQNYLQEVVEISTRVNYAQNLAGIHAMGMAISQVPSIANEMHVRNGNQQLVQGIANLSGANIRLNTTVKKVEKIAYSTGIIQYKVTTASGAVDTFDALIMASPTSTYTDATIQWVGLKEGAYFTTLAPPVEYITVHVTFVVGRMKPTYFFRGQQARYSNMPLSIYGTASSTSVTPFTSISVEYILSTIELYEVCRAAKVKDAAVDADISALEAELAAENRTEEAAALAADSKTYAFYTIAKLFSPAKMTDAQLRKIYAGHFWTYRTNYQAYPKLDTRTDDEFPPIVVDDKLYFPNAFEPYISTMETSTVSSHNVAKLLVQELTS